MLLEAEIFTESREYFQNRRKVESSIGSEGNLVSRSKVRRQISLLIAGTSKVDMYLPSLAGAYKKKKTSARSPTKFDSI